ncbi:hypothetical protein [uncultured Shewanella sp.]|uniref:hypothetical protein n=1 Tax=uncultured Shewanella sp. TaxID=173975 RepID=UPI00261236E3|nr:hypothetical protein [uncultured Shewanella sp.]
MDTEEKICSLMLTATAQQTLIAELITLQKEEVKQLKKERESLISAHRDALKGLRWNRVALMFFVCFCTLSFPLLGLAYFVVNHSTENVSQHEYGISEYRKNNEEIKEILSPTVLEKPVKYAPCRP